MNGHQMSYLCVDEKRLRHVSTLLNFVTVQGSLSFFPNQMVCKTILKSYCHVINIILNFFSPSHLIS